MLHGPPRGGEESFPSPQRAPRLCRMNVKRVLNAAEINGCGRADRAENGRERAGAPGAGADRALARAAGGATGGAGVVRVLAHGAVLGAVRGRNPVAASGFFRDARVHGGFDGPTYSTVGPPQALVAPAGEGAPFAGSQP